MTSGSPRGGVFTFKAGVAVRRLKERRTPLVPSMSCGARGLWPTPGQRRRRSSLSKSPPSETHGIYTPFRRAHIAWRISHGAYRMMHGADASARCQGPPVSRRDVSPFDDAGGGRRFCPLSSPREHVTPGTASFSGFGWARKGAAGYAGCEPSNQVRTGGEGRARPANQTFCINSRVKCIRFAHDISIFERVYGIGPVLRRLLSKIARSVAAGALRTAVHKPRSRPQGEGLDETLPLSVRGRTRTTREGVCRRVRTRVLSM